MAKKKVSEMDMYPFAHSALRRRYPASKGWRIIKQDHRGTYIPDFTIEKTGRKWTYRIPAEVKLDCKATRAHISQLNGYARNLAGSNVRIENKILIYPSGADTRLVPADIKVIYLRQFDCKK